MKTLFLIRHAKSSRDPAAWSDRNRPLSDRGRRDALAMAERLAKREGRPDLILSSPAARALATARIIAKGLRYKRKDIVVVDRLYGGGSEDLLAVIRKLGRGPDRVMLFGHNPELTELARSWASEIAHMPTCAVARFTFATRSWAKVGRAKVEEASLDWPKRP
jgi:phosphohistidine phosphatase